MKVKPMIQASVPVFKFMVSYIQRSGVWAFLEESWSLESLMADSYCQGMKVITDERCTTYVSPGHPERPARISKTAEKLRSQKEIPVTWLEPLPVEDAAILRAHTPEHLAKVKAAATDFDG